MTRFRDLTFIGTLLSLLLAAPLQAVEYRTIDGSNNNLTQTDWGRSNRSLVRMRDVIADPLLGFDPTRLAPAYEDGNDTPRGITDMSTPAGVGTSRLPNPRDISNTVDSQSTWGQRLALAVGTIH